MRLISSFVSSTEKSLLGAYPCFVRGRGSGYETYAAPTGLNLLPSLTPTDATDANFLEVKRRSEHLDTQSYVRLSSLQRYSVVQLGGIHDLTSPAAIPYSTSGVALSPQKRR